MSWLQEKQDYLNAGFTEAEVFEEEQRQRKSMFRAGFQGAEIDEYFGVPKFDPKPLQEYFAKNLEADRQSKMAANASGAGSSVQTFDAHLKSPQAKHAESFWEAIQAGWQMSVSGLIKRGQMPDIDLAQNEGMFYNIASQIGTLVGDIPAMWAGGSMGGAAGGAIGAPGGPVALATGAIGAGAGAFAVPAAVRKMLVDYYEKGSVKSAQDFWERAAATFIETAKGGIIGGATVGAAGVAGKVLAKPIGAAVWGGAVSEGTGMALTKIGTTTAEVAAMTTVGKALEGELPEPKEFLEAAIVVGGMHAVSSAFARKKVQKVIEDTYVETGIRPAEAVGEINTNPKARQEALSENPRSEIITSEITGEPTWYHGTKGDFGEFSTERLGESTGAASAKEGFFFTNSPEVAGQYSWNANNRAYVALKDHSAKYQKVAAKYGFPEGIAPRDLTIEEISKRNPGLSKEKVGQILSELQTMEDRSMQLFRESTPEWVRVSADRIQLMERYNFGLSNRLNDKLTPEILVSLNKDKGLSLAEAEKVVDKINSLEKLESDLVEQENLREANVRPVKLGIKNPFVKDYGGKTYRDEKFVDVIKQAKAEGYDSVIFKNTYDDVYTDVGGKRVPPHDVAVVFDPKQIRSQFERRRSSEAERGSFSNKSTLPPEPPVSEASKALLDNIGENKKPTKTERFIKSIPTWNEFYTAVVDKFDPIHKAVEWMMRGGDKLNADENPYILARMANDFKAKVKHIFQKGTIDFSTLRINGEGLGDILRPVKNDLQNLKAFLIGERVLELDKRGIKYLGEGAKNERALEAAKRVVEEGRGKYGEIAKRLVEFQNRNLQYLRDSGRLSPEMYEIFVKTNEKYIPFSRVFDAKEGVGKLGKAGFLKAIEGADLKIQDPFTSIVENTQTLVQLAEKNRAVRALVELAEKSDQQLLRKVHEQTHDGVGQSGPLKENQFEVFRDGKREVWETEPQLAESIKKLDGDITSQNILVKLANGTTKLLKLGITFTPDFILKNFLRDQLTAAAFGSKFAPWETLWAMGDIFKKSDAYYSWLKSGGAGGAFIELNEKYFTKDFLKIQKETGMGEAVFNLMKSPFSMLDATARLVEEATRLAEHKRVTKGATEGTILFEGGMASREVTLDFQRIGSKMSQLNAITAFQNVSIQGLDKTARALRAAWDNPGTAGKAMAPGVAFITTASILNWWNNHDQDWYKEINRWEKDLFWHVKVGDVITRWPKPQELGIAFGTMTERTLEKFFTDNPNAYKDFADTIQNLIVPSMMPDAVTPFAEHYANKVFFTGNPVVSQSAEKLLPAYQFTDYTSDTAKQLGKMIGMLPGIRDIGPGSKTLASPMVIENYIRDLGGSWGMYALKILDGGLHAAGATPDLGPAWTVQDIPFVKSFVTRYPSANSQSIKDFREVYSQTEQVWNTLNRLKKSGRGEDIQWLLEVHQGDMIKLRNVQEALINTGHMIQMQYADPKATASDKRQNIDALYFRMIEVAKFGNQLARDMKEKLKKLE